MELFAKKINGFKSLTIFAKSSILDDSHSSQYVSVTDIKKWDSMWRQCKIFVKPSRIIFGL